jgi:FkbM family methyltransferase
MQLDRLIKYYFYAPRGYAKLRGTKISLRSKAITGYHRKAIASGKYEAAESAIAKRIIEPTDRVCEIGTGLGYVTSICAKAAHQGKVLSIEANPFLIDVSNKTAALNKVSVDIRNAVVTTDDAAETVEFFVRKDFLGSSLDEGVTDYDEKVSVPCLPWDQIRQEFQPTVLVMDIEGHELDLLPAINLEGVNKVLVELHPWCTDNAEINAMCKCLFDQGFLFDFNNCSGNVVTFTR